MIHIHPESFLTGSTLQTLIKRSKDLGRTHFPYTDHGHLSSAFKAYNQVKKAGLKPIIGIEIYFKDSNCPIVSGTSADRCKYFQASIYCQDQASYQELCKIVSRTDLPSIEIHEEKQYVWGWNELEQISKFNTNIVLAGAHCMVAKTMLAGQAAVGEKVFLKIKDLFGSRMSVAMIVEPWSKKWANVVEITYTDGTKSAILANDSVSTDKTRKIKAVELLTKFHHTTIKSIISNGMNQEVNKTIQSRKLHEGFLPLPGGDAILKANRFLSALSNRHNVKILVSDYAYYAQKEDKIVQTMRLEGLNKLQSNFYMKSEEEVVTYLSTVLSFNQDKIDNTLKNNKEWTAQFDGFSLKYAWRLAEVESGTAIQKAMQIVKENKRMQWDNPLYVARLREELEVIHKNGIFDLMPYFLPIRDVLNHYKENGQLVGPGRGSAGGSLLCYLMGITQINPFKYDLPFQRFFSMVRIKGNKLPDIDVDLENRELLVGEDGHSGYLYGRWGNKAAQISTRSTIRLKSAILGVNRYLNERVEDSITTFAKGLPTIPQGITDHQFVFGYEDSEETHVPGMLEVSSDLQKYVKERPKEWEIVVKAMGITNAYSKHASAFVIADVPIQDIMPTKDGNITQYEAKETEEVKLIKYDFLVVKQLKDIRICLDLINKKNNDTQTVGNFSHQGQNTYIWDLPESKEVFQSIWTGKTETLFQINTASMIPYVIDMLPNSIMDLSALLALVRPGPLDFIDDKTGRNMTEEYMFRRKGESKSDIKEMEDLLPETFGVICYQEDLGKIARNLAGFSGEEAELLRENMAKKKMVELIKMKPAFIDGAKSKLPIETAEAIWEQMVTFGKYGFSIIHAVEYAHITYACMFLKHYYPLEWWAAVLTNATEQEISGKLWPHVKDLLSPPDINLSTDTMVVDYANHKIRSKLGIVRGISDKTIDPIVENRPYADIQDYVNKEVAGESISHKLIHVGILDSLFPPKSSLLEKLKMYQQAIQNKIYNDRVVVAEQKGKKPRALKAKEGVIPEEYLDLHPLKDAAMRKATLPSLPVDLYKLGLYYSKVRDKKSTRPAVTSHKGHNTPLVTGENLRRLAEIEADQVVKNTYAATTCFILKTEEFSYSKNTKRALKLTTDSDGFVNESVMWPDYDTGKLNYPKELKKGSIATIFFSKKMGKKDLTVTEAVVEA